jgi:cobalt-zinc-cadmium efflux system protein
MGHDHHHGHGHHGQGHDTHAPSAAADRRLLALALALILGFMCAEIVAGLVAHSTALLSDAGHMLTDTAAVALALGAAHIATRSSGRVLLEGLALPDRPHGDQIHAGRNARRA